MIGGYSWALRHPCGLTANTAMAHTIGNLYSFPRHRRANNAKQNRKHDACNPRNRTLAA